MNGSTFLRTRGLNPSRPGHVLCLSLTLPDMKFQSQRQFGKCTLSLPYTLLDLKVAKSFRCSCQFHLNFIATETSMISLCFGGEKWFCIGCFLFFVYSPWWFFPPGFKDSRPPPPQFIAFTHLIVTQGFDLSICASSPSLWEKHRNHWQKSSEIDWKSNQTSTSCWRWCFCQLNTVEGIIQTCSITFYNLPVLALCRLSMLFSRREFNRSFSAWLKLR